MFNLSLLAFKDDGLSKAMNILMVDKNYKSEGNRILRWRMALDGKGYNIVPCENLSDLPYAKSDLGMYDVAIANVEPGSKDAKSLYEEVKRRPEFRVMLHSGDRKYPDKTTVKESRQVIYSTIFNPDELIECVENGWGVSE
jgi:hypothetical protein